MFHSLFSHSIKDPAFFLPGCLRTTAIMNNTVTIGTNQLLQWKQMVIHILHPGKATVPKTKKNWGITNQNVQDHSKCQLCIWIQNPFWWWQGNCLWHDLQFLGSYKEKWTHRLARHSLYEKEKTSTKHQKVCENRMKKKSGGLQRPMPVLAEKKKKRVKILQWQWWLCRFITKGLIN